MSIAKVMNIYQCQKYAINNGYDEFEFTALFPAGPIKCKWVDAYFGILNIELGELKGKALMISFIDDIFPDFECIVIDNNIENKEDI